jgi:hypothetical protein
MGAQKTPVTEQSEKSAIARACPATKKSAISLIPRLIARADMPAPSPRER